MFEGVETFFGEPEERGFADHEVVSLHHRVVNVLRQQFDADIFLERRAVGLDEAALARERLDDALALELAIGFGDRVAVDAQLFGERPNRRQRVARLQRARRRAGLHLIDELQIHRLSRFVVQLKSHTLQLSYDSMTDWTPAPAVWFGWDARVGFSVPRCAPAGKIRAGRPG